MKNKLTKELFKNVSSIHVSDIRFSSTQYHVQTTMDTQPTISCRDFSKFEIITTHSYKKDDKKSYRLIHYLLDFDKLTEYITKNPSVDFVELYEVTKKSSYN